MRAAEAIDDLERARFGAVRLGVVRQFDPEQSRVRVAWGVDDDGAEVLTGWLPWGTWAAGHLRVWSPPAIGEQVLILSPSGDLAQAVAMPGIHTPGNGFAPAASDPNVTLLAWDDGGYLRYDRASGEMTICAPTKLRILADIEVIGRIDATGDVRAGAISLQTHRHGGVLPGGGQTGLPIGS